MKICHSKKTIVKGITIVILILVALWMTLSEVESWNRSPIVTSGNRYGHTKPLKSHFMKQNRLT